MTARRDFDPARALANPIWWGAAALLAVNDHVLKGAGLLPEVVTGKLSDAAGLLVAPILLAVVFRVRAQWALAVCHVVPLVALALLKLSPVVADGVVSAAAWVGETWSIMSDPTDLLVAVPAALASWRWLARPAIAASEAGTARSGRSLGARQIVMVGLAALACGATSRSAPQAPAIDRGRVIAGPWADDETYVIDPSGRALRKIDVPSGNPPTIFGGAMWSVRYDSKLGRQIVAIDLDTGRERTMPMPRGVEAGEVGALDGQSIYLRGYCAPVDCGGHDSRWFAIDLATGRVKWTSSTDRGSDIVIGDGIVAITEGSRLVVRDASGAVLYTRAFFDRASALGLGSAVLWVGDARGTLLALAPRDGRILGSWELGAAAGVMAPEYDMGAHRAAATANRIYLAYDRRIVAVVLGSPRPLWERPGVAVAVTGDMTIIETDQGALSGIDAGTGRSLWTTATGGTWGGFAVGDGIVARREGDPHVAIFDARTGRLLSRFDLDEGERASD